MTGHLDSVKDLLPLATGLLDEEQEKRVRDHLAGCDDCTRRWHDVRGERETAADETRHLPAAMIARWNTARSHLRGLERTQVRAHLERCPTCRDELRALGHEPRLTVAAVTPLAPARPGRRREGNLFAAGMVTAAIAAGFVLVLGLGQRAPEAGPDGVIPWVSPRALRGDRLETITLESGARALSVLVSVPLDAEPARPAGLEVRAPSGAVLLRSPVAAADVARGTLVVVLTGDKALPAGAYAVVFRQGALVEQTAFAVRHGGP